MKKVLYGTSALLVAGLVASAAEAAAPLKLNINGNLNAWMGYTDIDLDAADGLYNKFDVATNGTINFNAATKLDNGMTVGAVAELDIGSVNGMNGGEWDDVYAYAEGNFGKVILGATDNVAVLLHHNVPDVSPLDNSDLVTWVGGAAIPFGLVIDATAPDFEDNAQKISYISPKFGGFSVGASYIPGANFVGAFGTAGAAYDQTVVRMVPDFYNAWSVAGAYDGKIGGVSLGADLGISGYNVSGGDAEIYYNGGISAEIQGFTAAFSMIYGDLGASDGELEDAMAWEVGLGYKADKFGVSASWFESKNGDIKGGGSDDTKLDIFKVAGNYKLSAGVDAFAEFAYLDGDDGTNSASAWTIITGLGLTF
jgi:outer membrane protein OmpU